MIRMQYQVGNKRNSSPTLEVGDELRLLFGFSLLNRIRQSFHAVGRNLLLRILLADQKELSCGK